MLSLTVDLAIFKRLTGWPLDSNGRPEVDPVTHVPVNRVMVGPPRLNGVPQPSYGVRIPVSRYGVKSFDLTTGSPETTKVNYDGYEPDVFRQIPVFWEGTSGRDWESIWPCVIFGQTGVQPGSIFVYYDDIETPDPSQGTIIVDGQEVPAGYFLSPHPENKNLQYAIKVFAKTATELSLISAAVERLFPERTALYVERADGSIICYDMFRYLVDDLSTRPSDKEKSLVGDERFYGRAYNYRVEAYDDYTVQAFGDMYSQARESRILEYLMEIAEAQAPLITVSTETLTAQPVPLGERNARTAKYRNDREQPSCRTGRYPQRHRRYAGRGCVGPH